ncbi:hypothetical protein NG796_16905 [Laspinema sp. A4]|uniref:hypothetical protein n=1 Tax=Laspinema sp. D2d TaxID=2953686 RepID=UPI0021BA9B4C|nr:hypothetical protein [Laspinema sp. D2d]MCT7984953.1 hypothetical protein [Laspinema sp. D2d]
MKLIDAPWVERAGHKILQCHHRGDRRFSSQHCLVRSLGRIDSIANHYHRAKLFGNGKTPHNALESKDWANLGLLHIGWRLGDWTLPICHEPGHLDWGEQYQIALWLKYVRDHQALIEYAQQFDQFQDEEESQLLTAHIWQTLVSDGPLVLRRRCQPLVQLFENPPVLQIQARLDCDIYTGIIGVPIDDHYPRTIAQAFPNAYHKYCQHRDAFTPGKLQLIQILENPPLFLAHLALGDDAGSGAIAGRLPRRIAFQECLSKLHQFGTQQHLSVYLPALPIDAASDAIATNCPGAILCDWPENAGVSESLGKTMKR